MGRPSKVDSTLAERIASSAASTPAAILRELQAAGVSISGRTLRRHLAKAPRPAWLGCAPPEAPRAALAEAAGALEGTDVERLTRARDAIDAAMSAWRGSLGFDPRAVRAYVSLSKALGDVALRIAELNPAAPPDPEHDPANVKAKARLLALATEIAARP